MENNNSFEYTYSAPDQEEIRKIREKYLPKEQYVSKLDRLKMLDRKAEKKGQVVSLTLGIIGTLIMGAGMSCTMVLTDTIFFIPGIIVGVIGIGILSMAYPMYKKITKREREKIADEVIRLTDELMR